MTRLLRLAAFAIAVAGIVDPAFTLSGASRARVAVLSLRSAPPAAVDVRERLVREVTVRVDHRVLFNMHTPGRQRVYYCLETDAHRIRAWPVTDEPGNAAAL
jgi:hypothetical protein